VAVSSAIEIIVIFTTAFAATLLVVSIERLRQPGAPQVG
jgi:hypothetical protein